MQDLGEPSSKSMLNAQSAKDLLFNTQGDLSKNAFKQLQKGANQKASDPYGLQKATTAKQQPQQPLQHPKTAK